MSTTNTPAYNNATAMLPTPFYVVYEDRLRANLDLITSVAREAGVTIIMAFKANALWRTFPIFREYGVRCTASSLNELQLGVEELHTRVHSYCPAYTPLTIGAYLAGSSHITFNSLNQWHRFKADLQTYNAAHPEATVSAGLRVNPQCSVIETDIYNPALPGSRFGVVADDLSEGLPDGIEGLHFHALCESTSFDLEKVLAAFEAQFGHLLPQLKWVNFGGGHHITRPGYNIPLLEECIRNIQEKYRVTVYLEPGEAVALNAGVLLTRVLDTFFQDGNIAILDASAACHMPDVLEMPYRPPLARSGREGEYPYTYRLAGPTCLAGDVIGTYSFEHPLSVGERLEFGDMAIYTMVKNNTFNGMCLPAIAVERENGECQVVKAFGYEDFKMRL